MFEITVPKSEVDGFVAKLAGLFAKELSNDSSLVLGSDPILLSSVDHGVPCCEMCIQCHDFVTRRVVDKLLGILESAYIEQVAERSQLRICGHEAVV